MKNQCWPNIGSSLGQCLVFAGNAELLIQQFCFVFTDENTAAGQDHHFQLRKFLGLSQIILVVAHCRHQARPSVCCPSVGPPQLM